MSRNSWSDAPQGCLTPQATLAIPFPNQDAAGAQPALGTLRIALQPAGGGLANTIGVFKGAERAIAFGRDHMRDGVVLNEDGRPSPIVHQSATREPRTHPFSRGLKPRTHPES